MKVKATKVTWLPALDYVTEGKVYDVYNPTTSGLGYVIADDGCIHLSNNSQRYS